MGDSLAKWSAKGYGAPWSVGFEINGRDLIKGERGGRPTGVEDGAGGAPLPTTRRSPELGVWALPCTILEPEHTGRERESRRVRSRPFCGLGTRPTWRLTVAPRPARRSSRGELKRPRECLGIGREERGGGGELTSAKIGGGDGSTRPDGARRVTAALRRRLTALAHGN